MNTSKYILLSIMLLFPLFAMSQRLKPVTKREAEQIGKKTYILSTGEASKVVNTVGSGLEDEYSKFLFRKSNTAELDSIFGGVNSSYGNLEEAAIDVDRLLREVDLEQKINKGSNESLGFWIAKRNRDLRKKEKEAQSIVDNMPKEDPSIADLVRRRLRFGDKPTYYINGVEVSASVVNQLFQSEIIKRELRTTDTASGNPNGEIWFSVSEKALARVKIPVDMTLDYQFNETQIASGRNDDEKINQLSDYLITKEREERRSGLKPIPVVKREYTADGKYVDKAVVKNIDVKREESTVPTEEKEANTPSGTRVISRTVNSQQVNPTTSGYNVPAVSGADNRTSQPVVKRSRDIESKSEASEKKVDQSSSAPEKSVKRIKERHQN